MIDTRKMVRSGFVTAMVLGACGAFASVSTSANAADCLAYGSPVTLDGWLTLKPATAEQIAGGVAKNASLWSIKLAKPACMATDSANAGNVAVDKLPRLDLKVGANLDKTLRASFGKRVKVAGTLIASPGKGGAPVTLEGVRQEN